MTQCDSSQLILKSSTPCTKKCQYLYIRVVSINVDRFQQYLAHSRLKKSATQRLLTYPPHLRTAATLPWKKLIHDFRTFWLIWSIKTLVKRIKNLKTKSDTSGVCGWTRRLLWMPAVALRLSRTMIAWKSARCQNLSHIIVLITQSASSKTWK